MNEKIKRSWRLSPEAIAIIERVAKERQCSLTEALEQIILQHDSDLTLPNQVADLVEERFSATFTRLRLSSRTADINTQIILEVLNTLLYHEQLPSAILLEQTPSPVITEAEAYIKEKIAAFAKAKEYKKGRRI